VLTTIFVLTMVFYLMKDGRSHHADRGRFSTHYQQDVRLLFQRLGAVWNAYLRARSPCAW
jgi:predicted PurR-regulated permease PerM